jgi:GDP-L-fucose synthase
MNFNKNSKIYIAGHQGMVGSAILRILKRNNYKNILTKTRKDLDLTNQRKVQNFFQKNKINFVFLCAAKVGGIYANNQYPADFITENLMIQTNVISAAYKTGVKNLIFLGSSCVYPKIVNQKITENDLLSGKLELTNEPYAIAKIAGIKMCESFNRQYKLNYRSIMPTNLFGPGDNFHPKNSHVMAALIRKFIFAKKSKAKKVIVWGTGIPKREFLYVDDLAEAILMIAKLSKKKYKKITTPRLSHINVGYGKDYSIKEIANLIANSLNYKGKIVYDKSQKDGVKRKILNNKIMNNLGWKPKYRFEEKLDTYIQTLYKNKKFFNHYKIS